MGFLQAIFAATMSGLTMTFAPPALRGRINAFYLIAIIGVTPIGNLAAGETAQALGPDGPRWVLGGEGIVLILAAAIALATGRRKGSAQPGA
jgi:hypothetical protein